MAKLPPKIPGIITQSHLDHQNQWLELSHDMSSHQDPQHPWVDEFMEFSAAKRTAHRRSVSDSSVAFIEAGTVPTVPFLGPFRTMDANKGDHFDKFDDEQFMCMFSNDIGGSSSNPSSTSDHNSTNDDQKRKGNVLGGERVVDGEEEVKVAALMVKNEAEEVESSCKVDTIGKQGGDCIECKDNNGSNLGVETRIDNAGDGDGGGDQQLVDPKRYKRILANRQSAQRSRVRKLQYISELERSVTALQNEVSVLSPRVAFLDHQRMILSVDNSALKSKIAALAQDKIFKDAHQEALKREIERLRQVYYQQSLKQSEEVVAPSSSTLPLTAVQNHQPDTIANENEQFNN